MNAEAILRPQSLDAQDPTSDQQRFLLAAIIDSSEDAIISKDLNGIITSWNQAACGMFGYEAEEIVGQSISRLIPEELHHEEARILAALRAGERIEHYETTRVRKNGTRIEVSLTISPIKDNSGNVIGASKIARDITARKKMEQSLIQSEKLAATGRMAATIAHEINNPLESVMNLVYLARESCPSESEAQGYLQTAEKEIERISHIARQTLGYYRDAGATAAVSIQEVLESVLGLYHSRLTARRISVECQIDNVPAFTARRGELVQVFSNIIANSIDAMKPGGRLRVHAAEAINGKLTGVQVAIEDEGSGIEEEHLAKIFQPFFTTKNNLGNGIGLWIAQQLTEKHGGRIAITSSTQAGNSGTRVLIFLPFANPGGNQADV